jgi:Heterokaryon incompatibility protein (HET)
MDFYRDSKMMKILRLGRIEISSTRSLSDFLADQRPEGSPRLIKTGFDISGWTGSSAALNKLKSWLDQCNRHHQCIPEARRMPVLPQRVIDVKGAHADKLCLYEPRTGEKSRYVCLSHCWGNSQPFTTTVDTLQARWNGFSVDELPTTFRESVALTRSLGIRYLWIDSICIIQDSKDDWSDETSEMANIYGNAFLTICATASKDSTGGLYKRQSTGKHRAYNTNVYFNDEGRRKGPVYARVPLEHDATSPEWKESAPLSSRAWAMQEYLLSPRIVQFTEHELVWGCNQLASCECQPYPNRSNGGFGAKHSFEHAFETARWEHKKDQHSLFGIWRDVVTQYSTKQLSVASDRLPALSGLAHRLQPPSDGNYLAGLWKDDLLNELAWRTIPNTLVRKPGFRAPTWSWASVESPVEWFPKGALESPKKSGIPSPSVSAYCKPSTSNMYGAVKHGWLEAEGLVREATFGAKRKDKELEYVCQQDDMALNFSADYLLTAQGKYQVLHGEKLLLLLLGTMEGVRVHIVLRRYPNVPQSQLTVPVYLRIGLLNMTEGELPTWTLETYTSRRIGIL